MSEINEMREAFEAWRRRSAKMDPDAAVAREGFGDDAPYANRITRAMWISWIACSLAHYEAALAASPHKESQNGPI